MTLTSVTTDFISDWVLNLNWTDDAGSEAAISLFLVTNARPPSAYAGMPGAVSTIQAVAGQPMTYSVALADQNTGGAYSLYITVERLAP